MWRREDAIRNGQMKMMKTKVQLFEVDLYVKQKDKWLNIGIKSHQG